MLVILNILKEDYRLIAFALISFYSIEASALGQLTETKAPDSFRPGHIQVQVGGFWGTSGKTQAINIRQNLIGDTFTHSKQHNSNGLIGLGYYVEGSAQNNRQSRYGINGFYLPQTGVSGTVIQENIFTNLSYRYQISSIPVYAMAQSVVNLFGTSKSLVADIGIGPNFLYTHNFQEHSIDGGITIPDEAFSNHLSTTFSATAGLGIQFNQVLGEAPLTCGYRFFYLGQGRLKIANSQIINALKTGTTYANALTCAITI